MTDKDILYQMLEREIDNFISNTNPLLSLMAGPIKNFIFNFIDPYVTAFMGGDPKGLNPKVVESYVKEEVNEKVSSFMKKFEEQKAQQSRDS